MDLLFLFRYFEKTFFRVLEEKNLISKAFTGRPPICHHKLIRGLIYMLIRGWTWRELPRKYGTRSTAHRYFQKWASAGVFLEIWSLFLRDIQNDSRFSCWIQMIDGSDKMTKNMSKKVATLGYKHKSKSALKLSLVITDQGVPIALDICGANSSDVKRLEATLQVSALPASKGLPEVLLADKGYAGREASAISAKQGKILITPAKKNEHRQNSLFGTVLYKKRNLIERIFEKLYNFKRVDVPLERYLKNYTGWCHMALGFLVLMANV